MAPAFAALQAIRHPPAYTRCGSRPPVRTVGPSDSWFGIRDSEEVFFGTMREFTWSVPEKKAARAAFDLALDRELRATRQEAEAMLQNSPDDRVIWRVHDYLSGKRREIQEKYDYRYSVLMLVFSRLVSEGWLNADELAGIGAEKVDVIRKLMALR